MSALKKEYNLYAIDHIAGTYFGSITHILNSAIEFISEERTHVVIISSEADQDDFKSIIENETKAIDQSILKEITVMTAPDDGYTTDEMIQFTARLEERFPIGDRVIIFMHRTSSANLIRGLIQNECGSLIYDIVDITQVRRDPDVRVLNAIRKNPYFNIKTLSLTTGISEEGDPISDVLIGTKKTGE